MAGVPPIPLLGCVALICSLSVCGQDEPLNCVAGFRKFSYRDISGPVSPIGTISVVDADSCMGLCEEGGQGHCNSFVLEEFSRRQSTCHMFRSTLASDGLTLMERMPGTWPKYDYYEKSDRCANRKTSNDGTIEKELKRVPTLVTNQWSDWSSCSESCGGGLQIREKLCDDCFNDDIEKELKACNLDPCPGESLIIEEYRGRWSSWTSWSACPRRCEGTQKRYRICYAGQELCGPLGSGSSEAQTRRCRCARTNLSGTGFWTSWGRWAMCSVTCGAGEKVRTRQCTVPDDCEGTYEKIETCMEAPCVGPQFLDWTQWSPCSRSCGDGIRSRTRACGESTGGCVGPTSEDQPCKLQDCFQPTPRPQTPRPVINWSPWEEWSPCDVTCGLGTRTRNRVCPPGEFCPGDRSQSDECFPATCPGVDWLPWEEWAPCSETCGEGVRERIRECPPGGNCPGEEFQTERCNEEDCPAIVSPQWETWSQWYECSQTCGVGERRRSRECPSPGSCPGRSEQAEQCFLRSCPVIETLDWSPWGEWSDCSETCGRGIRDRERSCPEVGLCPGISQEIDSCIDTPCPQNWLEWEPWSPCSVTCGSGTRVRERLCPPGGSCEGPSTETVTCREAPCPDAAPGWSEWVEWSDCSATCGEGTQTRTRVCPTGICQGSSFDTRSCENEKCLAAGECQEWTEWGPCSTTCGTDGVQTRIRVCGLDYRPEADQKPCDLPDCEPVEGPTWLQWLPWSECSATCGGGVQNRFRDCSEPTGCVGQDEQTRICNPDDCPTPANPQWLQWGPWTDCPVTCGVGEQTRERVCSIPRRCPTGSETDSQLCTKAPCPGDPPSWLSWGPWSECTTTCGDLGVQLRNRECSEPGACEGSEIERQICDPGKCAEWSIWSPWGSCSVSCGSGQRVRTRSCPAVGFCPGSDTDSEACVEPPCEGPPTWLQWEPWSPCSATCGAGEQVRIRTCSEPFRCQGRNADSKPCDAGPCIFLDWSGWSPWSICSQSCAEGMRMRARACPKMDLCPGNGDEMEMCNQFPCPLAAVAESANKTINVINPSTLYGASANSTISDSNSANLDLPAPVDAYSVNAYNVNMHNPPATRPDQQLTSQNTDSDSSSPKSDSINAPVIKPPPEIAWVKRYTSGDLREDTSSSPVAVAFIRLKSGRP